MGTTQIRRRRLTAWLRRQGPTTVAAAAARFEVSERTIFRDLARLRARGVAVEGDPGRGGGIMLRPLRRRAGRASRSAGVRTATTLSDGGGDLAADPRGVAPSVELPRTAGGSSGGREQHGTLQHGDRRAA